MHNDGGKSVSLWHATVELHEERPLTQNESTDVCVIGAGLAGMSTAFLLAKAGKRVIVLDDGPVGGGETGRTTAHLSNEIDDRYYRIESLFGEEGAHIAQESQTEAIKTIEQIVREENIECDFERLDGFLFLGPKQEVKLLEDELAAAHRAGLSGVELLQRAPLRSFDTGPCLRFPDQAQFHPLKYLRGLDQAIHRMGGRVFTHTHVVGFKGGDDCHVETDSGLKVAAKAIVVATNTPVNDWVVMHTKQYPYRTYAIGVVIPKDSVEKGLYWDHLDPYHYIRIHRDDLTGDDILIVGGEDHKTGQMDDSASSDNPMHRFQCLEEWTRERFAMAGEVRYRWSGQVMEPDDGLAYLGRNPMDEPNVYIITGDSGMGMTNATAGAIIITSLITTGDHPWAKLYDPARKTLRAAGEFAKENLNFVAQFRTWFTGGDVTSPEEIPPGEGALIRDGATKLAVYRDADGTIHEHSGVCPHLGCIVEWNKVEKSWDCPCHGSRFDPYGRVMNGPALADLAKSK